MTTSYNLKKPPVNRKLMMRIIMGALAAACLFSPRQAFCQNAFENAFNTRVFSLISGDTTKNGMPILFPDDALGNIMTPSGFGGYGNYVYASTGGVYPQVYHTSADMIASGGFCVGNPVKAINFAASMNMVDLHRFRDFSGNFSVSRFVFTGSSISVGALQMFANAKQSDSPFATYYFSFSHAVQTLPSATPGSSKLTYTIGIGSGRFYLKSPDDIAAGRGKYGTAIYGGLSYELIRRMNLIAEWSGTNLGLSLGLRPFHNALSIGLGVINLTRYSADKPNTVFTLGFPLSLTR